MKVLKTFSLILLSILFAIFSIIFFLERGLGRTVLNFDFYEQAVTEVSLARVLRETLSDQILSELPDEVPDSMREGLIFGIQETLDEEWVEGTALGALDELLAWVKGESEEMVINIDLSERKDVLQEGVISYLETLPPTEVPPEILASIRRDGLEGFDEEIPDTITITHRELPAEVFEIRDQFQTYYRLSLFLPYLLIGLFLLIYILIGGVTGGLKWASATMIVSGTVGLISIRAIVPNLVRTNLRQVDLGALDIGIIEQIMEVFLQRVGLVPLIYVIIGLVIMMSLILFERLNPKNNPAEVQEQPYKK